MLKRAVKIKKVKRLKKRKPLRQRADGTAEDKKLSHPAKTE
jgi:hypothetical protein